MFQYLSFHPIGQKVLIPHVFTVINANHDTFKNHPGTITITGFDGNQRVGYVFIWDTSREAEAAFLPSWRGCVPSIFKGQLVANGVFFLVCTIWNIVGENVSESCHETFEYSCGNFGCLFWRIPSQPILFCQQVVDDKHFSVLEFWSFVLPQYEHHSFVRPEICEGDLDHEIPLPADTDSSHEDDHFQLESCCISSWEIRRRLLQHVRTGELRSELYFLPWTERGERTWRIWP